MSPAENSSGSPSVLEQLKKFTVVVADTGDFNSITRYGPRDATTNPSLILKSSVDPQYGELVDEVVLRAHREKETSVELVMDRLLIEFGVSILELVPGRVSTEVDARLSYDVEASLNKARKLIADYEARGYDRERILIKLATTWEGVEVSRRLEKEGIHCNMTLLFSLVQAVACAEANSQLISPFVGRILDWYRAKHNREYEHSEDPGVKSVRQIFEYYKKFGYPTEVMAASFRNTGEIKELAGCDLMTIGPKYLEEMQNDFTSLNRKLCSETASLAALEPLEISESKFRFLMSQDEMAHYKLAEGIRKFSDDVETLENLLAEKLKRLG